MFDLEKYRDELREHLGVDEDDLDNDACDLLVNRSYAWLLNAFKFRTKELSVKFNLVAGERNYDLPDDFESLRNISIEDLLSGAHTPLDRMTADYYESVYVESEDEWGKPTQYLRERNCIKLWKTPDDAYPVVLKYDRLLPDLDNEDNTTPNLPKNWEEFILMGAVYRGHQRFGDLIRSEAIKKSLYTDVQAAQPVEKKEELDTHRAALQAMLPEYEV